jgi:hypothetical protein
MNRTNSNKGKTYVHPLTLKLMVDATWQFAHTVLWNNQRFTKVETELSKHFIREYYEAIPAEQFLETASQHLSAYCTRIILARDYVRRSPYRYIPHPCIWLNRRYPKGFAGTKKWYERLWQKYELLKLLCDAGLEKEYANLKYSITL